MAAFNIINERASNKYAVGVNTKKNNQENNNISFGGWKAQGIPKGGFGMF